MILFCKMMLMLGITGSQHESMFTRKHCPPEPHQRIRIHLEDDEHLIVPKHATVKYIEPSIHFESLPPLPPPPQSSLIYNDDKKLIFPKPIIILDKKRPILLSQNENDHYELGGKLLLLDDEQNKNKNKNKKKKTTKTETETIFSSGSSSSSTTDDFDELFRQTLTKHNTPNFNSGIKPVVEENTEDDFNYDFRTKTHSLS